jgi:RNA polymerase sigma-70 factor, ECF subfamily
MDDTLPEVMPASVRRPSGSPASVVPLRPDLAIAEGLKDGQDWAKGALFERYGPSTLRLLRRILGQDRHVDLEDVLHDVFVEALASVATLKDPLALGAWLRKITIYSAYRSIRRRKARRWLYFWEPQEISEASAPEVDYPARQACQAVYRVLRMLPSEEHLAFALRHLEGQELSEVAVSLGVSLATAKRRLAKAEARFDKLAEREPGLSSFFHDKEGV